MLRTFDIVLVVVMLCATAWTFGVKHEAEIMEDRLRVVEREIAHERETIALLDADWSLLNQPYRLQRIAETFQDELKLQVFEPQQIVSPDELPAEPVRLVPAPAESGDMGGFAAAPTQRAVR